MVQRKTTIKAIKTPLLDTDNMTNGNGIVKNQLLVDKKNKNSFIFLHLKWNQQQQNDGIIQNDHFVENEKQENNHKTFVQSLSSNYFSKIQFRWTDFLNKSEIVQFQYKLSKECNTHILQIKSNNNNCSSYTSFIYFLDWHIRIRWIIRVKRKWKKNSIKINLYGKREREREKRDCKKDLTDEISSRAKKLEIRQKW